jgi:hypothetical protein
VESSATTAHVDEHDIIVVFAFFFPPDDDDRLEQKTARGESDRRSKSRRGEGTEKDGISTVEL